LEKKEAIHLSLAKNAIDHPQRIFRETIEEWSFHSISGHYHSEPFSKLTLPIKEIPFLMKLRDLHEAVDQ